MNPVAGRIVALALYHAVAFLYWDVAKGEARAMTPDKAMMAPYGRLIVLHITIIIGAFLVIATGQPIAALAMLVVLKTLVDLQGQLKARGIATNPIDARLDPRRRR